MLVKDYKGGFYMLFEAWMPLLLCIGGGSLILSLLLLLSTNRYTKKKLKEMEQEDAL
jgi:hypothetical protein